MKTWLQWVSKGPRLSASLVPKLWPSPPRTMGDCLHLPLSSAIIMIIIQRPDSADEGKLRPRYSQVKACTEHCCLLKGLCQNSPLPTPLVLNPRPDPPTHCQGSPWAIQLYRPRRQAPYIFGHRAGLEPGCARCQAKTQWPRFNEIRYL